MVVSLERQKGQLVFENRQPWCPSRVVIVLGQYTIDQFDREYALFMADGAYAPETLTHIPGITNTIADILSRRNDPQYRENWKPPEFLASAKRVYPPIRNDSWWLSRVVSQS